jgi:hypothetical protein
MRLALSSRLPEHQLRVALHPIIRLVHSISPPPQSHPRLGHRNVKCTKLGPGHTDLSDLGLPFGPISDVGVTHSRYAVDTRITLL